MQTGTAISGIVHLGLLGWVILRGAFSVDPEPIEVAQVAIVSSQEYAALLAAQDAPETALSPAALTPPEETPVETPADPSPVEEAAPDRQDPAETRPQPPETVQPDPPPVPETPQETPEAEVTDTAPEITEPQTDTAALVAPPVTPRPEERPVDREAPRPAPPAPSDARPDTVEEAPVAPEGADREAPEAETATAPQEATDIAPEAPEETASAAPTTSVRPPKRPARPSRPAETPAPTAAAQPATPSPTETAQADASREEAVDEAVAAALAAAGAATAPAAAPVGPPMTGGEKEALRVAVSQCWNVGSLSSAALETTVTVALNMTPDGKPVSNSIRLIGFSGGPEAAARQAFEAARRAILRCGGQGYNLPPEKFDHWRDIEMTFNPEKMQYR